MPDADPLTMTDPLDDDTDGDGFTDGAEDTNGNGAVDPGESDPLDPGSPAPHIPTVGPLWLISIALMLVMGGIAAVRRNGSHPRRG